MVKTKPNRIVKLIFITLILLITFVFGVQSNDTNIPTRVTTVEKFLTSDGALYIEEPKQFRKQRLPDLNSNSSSNNKFSLNSAYKSTSFANLDSTKSYFWESDQWVDSLRLKYFYNVNGALSYSSKQYWENMQWEYNLNTSFTYNENGYLSERIEQDWESDFFEYIILKTIISYNIDGTLADSSKQYWNDHFEQWDDNAKTRFSYLYDEHGNQTEFLYQISQWYEEAPYWTWTNNTKAISTYDLSNNLTEYILQTWNGNMQTWYNSSRYTLDYDSYGNLIDSSTYYWDDSQWVGGMNITFTYDNNDNQIGRLDQYYEDGQWINTWNFTYDYDVNGNQTEKLEQYWDDGTWENSWKDASTYDVNNNITENIGQYWNWSINQWTIFDRHTATYDENGNPTEYLVEVWDNNQWNNSVRRTSYYSQMTTTGTGTGSNVEITLDGDIVLLFDSVSTAGSTGVTVGNDGPVSNDYDFFPFESPEFIYVSTDAEYIDQVEICFPYNGTFLSDEEENQLRVFHFHQGEWIDITTSHDKGNDIICGETISLSPFALGIPKQATDINNIDGTILPQIFKLAQNYPNPFNPSTVIQFDLPRRSRVEIEVYNILGQTVRNLVNDEKPAGQYSITWNGRDNSGGAVSSGMYFYKIKTDDFTSSKKMILLK